MISIAAPCRHVAARADRAGMRRRLLGTSSASRRPRVSDADCHASSSRPEVGLICHIAVTRPRPRSAVRTSLALLAGALPPRPTRAAHAYFANITHHPERVTHAQMPAAGALRRPVARLQKPAAMSGTRAERRGVLSKRRVMTVEAAADARHPCFAAQRPRSCASAGCRGAFPRDQLCRAQDDARCARPAITRTTTAQWGKPRGLDGRRVPYSRGRA